MHFKLKNSVFLYSFPILRYMKHLLITIIIQISICLLCCCSRLEAPCDIPWEYTETISVNLPVFPYAYQPQVVYWNISWYDGRTIQTKTVQSKQTAVTLTVKKNKICPVVFYPYTHITFFDGTTATLSFFKPAAAIYPVLLQTSWEQGVIGELLLRLFSSGTSGVQDYCTRFNWQRLHETIIKKTAETQQQNSYDPWRIDIDHLLSAIVAGNISIYDIHCYDTQPVSTCLPSNYSTGILLQQYALLPACSTQTILRSWNSPLPEQVLISPSNTRDFYLLREVVNPNGKTETDGQITLAITAPPL